MFVTLVVYSVGSVRFCVCLYALCVSLVFMLMWMYTNVSDWITTHTPTKFIQRHHSSKATISSFHDLWVCRSLQPHSHTHEFKIGIIRQPSKYSSSSSSSFVTYCITIIISKKNIPLHTRIQHTVVCPKKTTKPSLEWNWKYGWMDFSVLFAVSTRQPHVMRLCLHW